MQDAIKKLMDRAKADPKFFHALVFEPDKVAAEIEDRQIKAAIFGIDPERLLGSAFRPPGLQQWCDETCGASSCIDTCGARSCGTTCSDSCGTTCSHSCGDTTKFTLGIQERVIAQR